MVLQWKGQTLSRRETPYVMVPRYVCLGLPLGFKNLYGPQACFSGKGCGGDRGIYGIPLKHVQDNPLVCLVIVSHYPNDPWLLHVWLVCF